MNIEHPKIERRTPNIEHRTADFRTSRLDGQCSMFVRKCRAAQGEERE